MFWVGTASAVAGGLVLAFVLWLISLAWKRFTQRKLTKAERLKARLRQHRWELRNLGAVALLKIFYLIFQAVCVGSIIANLFTFALGEYSILIENETTPSLENLRRLYWFFISIPIVFLVWTILLFVGPVRRILLLVNFSDWQERHLVKRIKQLEPNWNDTNASP
jgi:hypothetical protein